MLRRVRWIACVGILAVAIGKLRRNLLMEGSLVRLGLVGHVLDRRLDVLHGHGLLGARLMHGNVIRAVLLEYGFLRQRVRLRLGKVANGCLWACSLCITGWGRSRGRHHRHRLLGLSEGWETDNRSLVLHRERRPRDG